jgi:hypothetical protein
VKVNKLKLAVMQAIALVCGAHSAVRAKTQDISFTYRMGAGFPGDVNRTHPAAIEATLLLAADPDFFAFGQMGILSANNSFQPITTAQASDSVVLLPWGALVRSFPAQAQNAGSFGADPIGGAIPPITGVVDVLRNGLIMAKLNAGVAAPKKGSPVYLWAAATSGNHVLGGYETAASAGNTVKLDPRYVYNGPPDANGVVEIAVNV